MFRPRATVAKIRMLAAMVVYWSVLWVKGKHAAAAKAAAKVTLRCLRGELGQPLAESGACQGGGGEGDAGSGSR